jgi:plasmid stabilization system protein ParE
MRLEILDQAEAELADAIAHYEAIEPGLGVRLKQEVRLTLAWIEQNPELARLRPKGYRRVNLKVFPYYIAYAEWAGALWVLAVAHGARRPEYWVDRTPRAS